MTSKERVKTAFAHREPDRVPVFELCINKPVADRIMDRPMITGFGASLWGPIFYEYARKNRMWLLTYHILRDTIKLYEKLDLDIFPMPLGPAGIKTIEKRGENLYRWITPDTGGWCDVKVNLEYDTWGEVDGEIHQKGMDGFRDLVKRLETRGVPKVPSWAAPLIKFLFRPVRHRFLLGQADILIPNGTSWFDIFMEAMVTEPELVESYLTRTTDFILSWVEIQAKAGFDGIIGGTDIAGINGPFVSPAMFKKFFQPQLRRITDKCHELGMVFVKHTDGNITIYGDEFLLGCGFDGYHAIEPRAGMDIRALKKSHGDKLTFLGNLDCARLLPYGTLEEVKKETRELIRDVAPGGGYVFSSSNSIHSDVKKENFLAMLAAAREFGQYPVAS